MEQQLTTLSLNTTMILCKLTEILKEWLNGSGKQPVTWEILIETLDDCNLVTLAEDIKAVK